MMKTWYLKWVLLAVIGQVLIGCEEEEGINPVPEIEFREVSTTSVAAYQDSLTFTIFYRDGDGDLGENNTDEDNIFLEDSRNGVVFGLRIQQLAPDNAEISIQGDLHVTLPNVPMIGENETETVSYDIWLKDRAGNESNRVNSGTITVTAN